MKKFFKLLFICLMVLLLQSCQNEDFQSVGNGEKANSVQKIKTEIIDLDFIISFPFESADIEEREQWFKKRETYDYLGVDGDNSANFMEASYKSDYAVELNNIMLYYPAIDSYLNFEKAKENTTYALWIIRGDSKNEDYIYSQLTKELSSICGDADVVTNDKGVNHLRYHYKGKNIDLYDSYDYDFILNIYCIE